MYFFIIKSFNHKPGHLKSEAESALFQEEFLQLMGPSSQLTTLFDLLPEAYFFVKNRDGHFVFANQSTVRALGLDGVSEMLGRSDYDFFPADLAERYRDEDHRVMSSGQALLDQVWLVPHSSGQLHWYLSSKQALFSADGRVIGIAGVMRDFDQVGSILEPYQALAPVLEHVQSHYQQRIEVTSLASLANLSVSQLERSFKHLFRMTPLKYVTEIRIHAACKMLVQTRMKIGAIAADCGFYDQSHFTRQFRKLKGTTPLGYRKQRDGLAAVPTPNVNASNLDGGAQS